MSDESMGGFCAHCGKKLDPGISFCSECGTPIGTADAPSGTAVSNTPGSMGTRLVIIAILMGLLAAIALVSGVPIISNMQGIMDSLVASTSWPDLVKSLYDAYGWTEQQSYDFIYSMLQWIGYYFVVIGVLAVIGCVICVVKKYWAIGLVIFIIASLMMTVTVLGLVIGIVVTYLYYTTKPEFTS